MFKLFVPKESGTAVLKGLRPKHTKKNDTPFLCSSPIQGGGGVCAKSTEKQSCFFFEWNFWHNKSQLSGCFQCRHGGEYFAPFYDFFFYIRAPLLDLFSTAVPTRRQTCLIPSGLPPKRDCSAKNGLTRGRIPCGLGRNESQRAAQTRQHRVEDARY